MASIFDGFPSQWGRSRICYNHEALASRRETWKTNRIWKAALFDNLGEDADEEDERPLILFSDN